MPTTLFYNNACFELKNALYYEDDDDNEMYNNDMENLNNELIGWRISVFDGEFGYIGPYINKWLDISNGGVDLNLEKIIWDNIKTNSSKEYIEKFNGFYTDDFPFIAENVTENLSDFLKKHFYRGKASCIFKVDVKETEYTYIIRFNLENEKTNFSFTIMDLQSDKMVNVNLEY